MDPSDEEFAEYKAHLMSQMLSALEDAREIPLLLITCHNRPNGGIEASIVLTDALPEEEVRLLLQEAFVQAITGTKGG